MPRGVRLNPEHDQRTRAKIQTSQIINRLEKLVFGEIWMTAQQVSAAQTLLRKTIPDLSAVTLGGDQENPLKVIGNITITPVKPKTLDE